MPGWPAPAVRFVIDQPLVRATHRKGYVRQYIAAWKSNDKPRKPWPGGFPQTNLAAANQAKYIEESSQAAYVGRQ